MSEFGGGSGSTVIRARGLHMRYGARDVLREVDLTVDRGQVVVLLGPNGAGKTTTVEILEGFRRPTSGQVEVLGVDPAEGDEHWRAGIGTVFQSWRDHGKWRVRELLEFSGRHYAPYSRPDRTRPRDVDELLALVGLSALAGQQVRRLSGGERRRLDVALGLVGRPEVLFLDEPTTGFDPRARRELHDLLHALVDFDDTTIILTTHDLHEAEQLADRILILASGQVIADGTADELARGVDRGAEVRWRIDGTTHVHVTHDASAFVAELEREQGSVDDLQVRPASLEDAYLALVREAEEATDAAAGAVPMGRARR